MRGVIAWFAGNHVAANLLMMFLILAGIVTLLTIKIEVFPEASLDSISISVAYQGASPEEVEQSVIRLIEENVAGLAGVKTITSVASEGSGSVTIEVMKGWDLKKLLDEVKAEVDRITNLPDESEQPIVREIVRRRQVITVAVYGDADEGTIKHLAEKVKDDITNLKGITLAELTGVRTPEIHIEISEKTLRRYGLTLNKVAEAVRKASLDLPAGNVKTAGGEILVRTKGRRYYARDYYDIPILTNTDGTKVLLGQIAELNEGFEDIDKFNKFEGKTAATIDVFRVADQNALDVSAAVKKYIKDTNGSLPEGVHITTVRDRSKILNSRMELLLKNMAIGLVLVIILLAVFMDARLSFWVTLGIPISFLFGLSCMPYYDVSINMISLFAFILVLGIVVDDAIVVGENIFRKYEEGYKPLTAAVEGAMEVGHPVVFAVLTTVVAFAPLAMGGGSMGKVMRVIPIVVILVLLGSLVESLLILPAHLCSKGFERRALQRKNKKTKLAVRALRWMIAGPYHALVRFCVRWRYPTLALGVAMLLVTAGIWQGGHLKFTFFPKVESDNIVFTLTMPVGTPLERTMEIADHVERVGRKVIQEADAGRPAERPELFKYSITGFGSHSRRGGHGGAGSSGGNLAQVRLLLLDGEQRTISSAKLAKLWRERVGPIPDAMEYTYKSVLFTPGNAIEVHLSMDHDKQLLEADAELKAELHGLPGVFDVEDSFLPGKDELQLKLKPAAHSLGLTLDDLARQVRHAFYGAEALRLQRDKDDVKVLVRFPEAERRLLTSVEDMRIRTPDGLGVPFGTVAKVTRKQGYASIDRSQRQRVVMVSADVDEAKANANEVRNYLETQYLPELAARHSGLRYKMEGAGKEQKESMRDVILGFVLALFGIYALLAIPFRSFSQPLVVMIAIPFGIVGAIFGHLLMGYNLSFLSVFGVIGLAGVVVNDSLVLIHAANRFREQGMDSTEAVIKAGQYRFRAILLTSLTTFAGLSPMILEKSLQAQFLIPMAISLGFGVLFATGITLLLVPSCYIILDDLHMLVGKNKGAPNIGGEENVI